MVVSKCKKMVSHFLTSTSCNKFQVYKMLQKFPYFSMSRIRRANSSQFFGLNTDIHCNINYPSRLFSSIFPFIVAKNIQHSFLNVHISSNVASSRHFMVAMDVSAANPNVTSFNRNQKPSSEKSRFCISDPSLFSNTSDLINSFKFSSKALINQNKEIESLVHQPGK